MSLQDTLEPSPAQTNRIVTIGLYLIYLAVVGRTLGVFLAGSELRSNLGWALGLELIFLLLFTLVVWRSPRHRSWLYFYFVIQSAIIVMILSLSSQLDFVTTLFLLLSYQVALLFSGRTRWAWVIGFALVVGGSMALFLGPFRGLTLGLVTITALFVIAAFIVSLQEVETARARSQAILYELEATQKQLEQYAGQVEELTAIEERNRLARELHDSVSQTLFSIQLNARAAQLLLEKDPTRVRTQLERLHELVQFTLTEMRGLITHLRLTDE